MRSEETEGMKAKYDHGRKAYEEELEREPTYRASGKARPQWNELPMLAQDAWRRKAKHDDPRDR